MGAIEHYRRELYRIAWRMQYREKRDRKREVSKESDNNVMLQSYINKLAYEASKKVTYEIYINDKTEAQVAKNLKSLNRR